MPDSLTLRLAQLLRRAEFSATPAAVAAATAAGLEATVDALLAPAEPLTPLLSPDDEKSYRRVDDKESPKGIDDLKALWVQRLISTQAPLREKMVLFWHGHFACSNDKVDTPLLMAHQNDLFRRLAFGRFADLLLAVTRDPAMLYWLDGDDNRNGSPNENYGRECMELFTLGRGNYTEDDVKAAARAFTGWHVEKEQAVFADEDHDHGSKRFLGSSGDLDDSAVVSILAAKPETARYLVSKLWRFFAYASPEEAVVQGLAAVYLSSGGDMRAVLRALFLHDAFYSDRARGALVKSPVEFVVQAVRQVAPGADPSVAADVMADMGQDLFAPPNVAGWPGGLTWINAGTLLYRFNFGADLAAQFVLPGIDPATAPPPDGGFPDPARVVQEWAVALGGLQLSDESKAAIAEYAGPAATTWSEHTQLQRRVIHSLLSCLEFQFN